MPTFALNTSCSHDGTDTLRETSKEISDPQKNMHKLDIGFIMRLVRATASRSVLLFTNRGSFGHCQIMEAYKERPGGFICFKPYDRCSVCRPVATVRPACHHKCASHFPHTCAPRVRTIETQYVKQRGRCVRLIGHAGF